VKDEMQKTDLYIEVEGGWMLFEMCLPGVMFKALAFCKRLNWSFSIWRVKSVRRGYLLCCDPGSSGKWVCCADCVWPWEPSLSARKPQFLSLNETEKQRAGASFDGAYAVGYGER